MRAHATAHHDDPKFLTESGPFQCPADSSTQRPLLCLTLEVVGRVVPAKHRPDVRSPNSTDMSCALVFVLRAEIDLDLASPALGPHWGLHRHEPELRGRRFV